MNYSPPSDSSEEPKWLYDPVIHLYWAYALARAEEMFKVTCLPPGVCGAQAEREYVTLHPKKITYPIHRAKLN